MNRKEWREVGLQSLYFVLAVAGMVLLALIGDLLNDRPLGGETIAIILGLLLMMFSMFMGLSPFAMDAKQKGMEYLLTLPYSRRRLLLIKFLPRLVVVILFYLAFAAFYGLAGNAAFGGGFTFFSLAYFALFFISFSLAVVHENFIIQSLWAGVALCGYLALCLYIVSLGFSWKFKMPSAWVGNRLWYDLAYDVPTLLSTIAVFLLMATPFVASLFLSFKKFDLKPARAFTRRQLLFFVPLLLLAFAASLGVTYFTQTSSNYSESDFFILKNNKLLKSYFPGELTLYEETGRRSVDMKGRILLERLLLEQGEKLYLSGLDLADGSRIIGCLSQSDFSWKILHRIPGRYFVPYGYIGIRYDGS
ncbi:MAG: ABC-2 transporter permease, partial [Acidobacteriota bacterium]|nr:ABC-2 transporter permease [Acidobacteriota bacterium]